MELLYNPDHMSAEELKATFVGRETLLQDMLDITRRQPDGAGVQHIMVIAPRGMGKTSLLQRFRLAVLESELAETWLPLKYPEELYSVADLADFWLVTLRILAVATDDKTWGERAYRLPAEFSRRDDIADAALALLKSYRQRSGKRLLLLVENMDDLLGNIAKGVDAGKLRDVLMNDGALMIAGSAVKFFKQAGSYDQPLYNFFRIFDLEQLSCAEAQQLLLKRADRETDTALRQQLQDNPARLQTLHYFTGGVPRLVLMLYRILAQSDIGAVREALVKLLDEVTPYYKARVEVLPIQQRQVLDIVTRLTAETRQGSSNAKIAQALHLPPGQVNAQLKRLVDAGYLFAVPLRGRKSCYVLSEPLYSLWHQMRLNPEIRAKKLAWLVDFLRDWYDDRERVEEARRLLAEFEKAERAGDGTRADSIVEHITLLGHSSLSTQAAGSVLRAEAQALWRLKNRFNLTDEERTAELFVCIEEALQQNPRDCDALTALGILLMRDKQDYQQALRCFDAALQLNERDAEIWRNKAIALYFMQRYEEALPYNSKAVELNPGDASNWNSQATILESLDRFDEALAAYQRALDIDAHHLFVKDNLVRLLPKIEDYLRQAIQQNNEDAVHRYWQSLSMAIETEPGKQICKRCVLFAAELGQWALARQLLETAGLGEELFPLARALEFLQTGDQEVIDRLSPEVRGAVKLVAEDLRAAHKRLATAGKSHFLSYTPLSTDEDYIKARGHLIHKLKAKDSTGRWAYYFVLVLAPEEPLFLAALDSQECLDSQETTNLENYGLVIASCYGEEPNEPVRKKLKEKYGFTV